MDLILDANVLFAALIRDSFTAHLIFRNNVNLFAPQFLIEEIDKYREEILKKTKRNVEEFEGFLSLLKELITIVPTTNMPDNKKVLIIAIT